MVYFFFFMQVLLIAYHQATVKKNKNTVASMQLKQLFLPIIQIFAF